MPERCELTDLYPAECACRHHRGGRTPQEEVELIQRNGQVVGRRPTGPDWLPAMYAGLCPVCSEDIRPGQFIRPTPDGWACCE